jgi:hypothetical protein
LNRRLIERQAQEKLGLISRVEAKFKARNAAAEELTEAIKRADSAFRRVVDLSVEIDAAWGFFPGDRNACSLSPQTIATAVAHDTVLARARVGLVVRIGAYIPG